MNKFCLILNVFKNALTPLRFINRKNSLPVLLIFVSIFFHSTMTAMVAAATVAAATTVTMTATTTPMVATVEVEATTVAAAVTVVVATVAVVTMTATPPPIAVG